MPALLNASTSKEVSHKAQILSVLFTYRRFFQAKPFLKIALIIMLMDRHRQLYFASYLLKTLPKILF